MIEKRHGDFVVAYDPVSDIAKLFYSRDLLVAESTRPDCWTILHGPAWFEFEHNELSKRREVRFGSDLRGWLQHTRALSGKAVDVLSELHRTLALREFRAWDKFMRTWPYSSANPAPELETKGRQG